MSSLENIYNNVTEALKTQDKEALAKLKEEYLAVFSGSTFASEQLDYIWNEQYIKGKPDASIPFQEVAYVTNSQFAIAYKDEEVIVTAVNKGTKELFTYKAKVTGNVNDANQIEVKTAKGALVYVKKSNIQPTKAMPINVRVNFNQINSIMMTAVDRTSGEIAKFNTNGEKDAQGDTQLNVFVPKQNATMIEVRKSLASGQSVGHILPIHAGARINTASAYRQGKNSVYLTASVAGIDTSIQTVEPVLEQPTQPTDAKADIERRRQEELLKWNEPNDARDEEINARYDKELAALEQPIEPEVTTNLTADEKAILSFDVSALKNLESAAESLDQNTAQEIDNAGSCKL